MKGGKNVFKVGDKIVYPIYGAGTIRAFEEKEIDGKNILYYDLLIPVGNLKILVPASKAEMLNIRKIFSSDKVIDIINSVSTVEMPDNWNIRYKSNMEKIKTGNLKLVAEVYKTLIFRERRKPLSSAEKKMLGTVKQIIISEIIVSANVAKSEAEKILEASTDNLADEIAV